MIGIINYIGNIGSVKNALDYLEIPNFIADKPADLEKATHIIIPGVGNWTEGVKRLKPFYKYLKKTNKKILGICLGFQLMAEKSEEGEGRGLGLIKGRVVKLESKKLPHVGWAEVGMMDNTEYYYFVHSYHFILEEFSVEIMHCKYDGQTFNAYLSKDNVTGVQMHVEKSQQAGLNFIKEWYYG